MTITQAQLDEWKKSATEQDEGGCIEAVPALVAEVEALRHDIARHVTIASDLATEVERLRAALRKIDARRYGERHTVRHRARDRRFMALRMAVGKLRPSP